MRFSYFTHQRLNVGPLVNSTAYVNKHSLSENRANFHQWLVGFTDGDGSFSVVKQNNKWSLIFKIGQSTYNLRVLQFIKKQLGAGNIYVEKNRKMADFRIRDLNTINTILIPIFEEYPLLTTKFYNYEKFKNAYVILSNSTLSKIEKDKLLNELSLSIVPSDYISPAWKIVNNTVSNYETASRIMTKGWLIGFTEAEGSFYLVNKTCTRIVHGFEITPKLDKIVLMSIKYLLHINTNVSTKKAGYFSIATTNSRAIENIINYYHNTMKGMKSAEFKIWNRSYKKHKGDYLALEKIRNNVRIMKNYPHVVLNKKKE